jgi:peptidoglycan/xylan/chitin deacetylase (PgdA/CDA1 family)
LAHCLPSALILPALARWQPEKLGPWCRWRTSSHDAVALTFDDGPDVDTLRTLDLLEELDLRATFFVLGSQLVKHPGVGKEIITRGHELGTHGFRHRHHLLSTPGTTERDLSQAIAVHRELIGAPPRYFRPPFGQLALPSVLAAQRRGLETVLWSSWGKEWVETEPAAILRRLSPGLTPGAIVLLHDNDVACPAGTGARTRVLLQPIAAALRARGLRSATLGELGTVDRRARPNGETAA